MFPSYTPNQWTDTQSQPMAQYYMPSTNIRGARERISYGSRAAANVNQRLILNENMVRESGTTLHAPTNHRFDTCADD